MFTPHQIEFLPFSSFTVLYAKLKWQVFLLLIFTPELLVFLLFSNFTAPYAKLKWQVVLLLIFTPKQLEFLLQGVPFEKSQKEMAVALKQCIFDPMLVKPKCI